MHGRWLAPLGIRLATVVVVVSLSLTHVILRSHVFFVIILRESWRWRRVVNVVG
jgi:hypothetical protein